MSPLRTDETHTDLQTLVGVLKTLPKDIQTTMAGPVIELNNILNRKAKILNMVRDALSQLRMDMKYLLFDLEATRRERDEYKAQLEKQ